MLARFRRDSGAPSAPKPTSSRRTPLLSLLIVGVVGVLILTDMLVDQPTVDGFGTLLLDYAVIIAVFALLLGLVHLIRVHARRVTHRRDGWPYSLFLLVVTVAFSAIGLIEGADGSLTQWAVSTILLPLQAAFFSLLAFFLASVLYRAARVRSVDTLLMGGTALIVVIAGTPIGATFAPWLVSGRTWLMESVATAGARALLLGIGLGTIITAFRFIADGRRLFK